MPAAGPGRYRWRIVALLFLATTINYIDRQVLSFTMLDEPFRKEMLDLAPDAVLTEADQNRFKVEYGYVDAAFKFAYAAGFLVMGWLADRLGTRRGFSLGILIWSLAGTATAFIGSLGGLKWARALLGLGEAANFPSSIKTVAEWFPKREHSFASGLFNAGANAGIIVTAAAIPWLTAQYGWRASFLATGVLGFLLLVLWRIFYQTPERSGASQAELDYIRAGQDTAPQGAPISWRKLLGYRQTWVFITGKFLADPIWWLYLSWLPDFFNSGESLSQKLDLKTVGIPFLVIYIVSDLGSIFFGWLATRFMERGWSMNRARKTTMLLCALAVTPMYFASTTQSLYLAVALIALAAAAHQGWSANMYSIASGLFPRSSVASVTGIGGMAGAIGGVILAAYAGVIRVQFGYLPLFVLAGSTYLLALGIIQLLAPKLEPVQAGSGD